MRAAQALAASRPHHLERDDYQRFMRHLDAMQATLAAQRQALGEHYPKPNPDPGLAPESLHHELGSAVFALGSPCGVMRTAGDEDTCYP